MATARQLQPIITWVRDFAEGDAQDKAYWLAQTPQTRLRHMEELRRMNYGQSNATARLQRVIEFVKQP